MPTEAHLVEVDSTTIAVIASEVGRDELRSFFDRSFSRVAEVAGEQGRKVIGPAIALYQRPPSDTIELSVGFPTDLPVEPSGEVSASSLPGGRVARMTYRGGYDGLAGAWDELLTWVSESGLEPTGASWEEYVTKPALDSDPVELITELNCLLR